MENDVAIIHFKASDVLPSGVHPICLPTALPSAGRVFVSGWGSTESGIVI